MEELLKPGRQGERAITPRPPTDGRTREETGTLREPQHEVMLQQAPRSSPTATWSPLQSSPTPHKHQLCAALKPAAQHLIFGPLLPGSSVLSGSVPAAPERALPAQLACGTPLIVFAHPARWDRDK